jgi:hypothetical protein
MTERPGKIKAEFRIDLPRPRRRDIIATPGFAAIETVLLHNLSA